MSPSEQLDILLERIEQKNRELTLEIQLITAWIKEHRERRPPRVEVLSPTSNERREYHSWRKVSYRLHQRRSELKTKQGELQALFRALVKKNEERETSFFGFPVFPDMTLGSELVSADT